MNTVDWVELEEVEGGVKIVMKIGSGVGEYGEVRNISAYLNGGKVFKDGGLAYKYLERVLALPKRGRWFLSKGKGW